MSWEIIKEKLVDEAFFFNAFPWLAKENQNLLRIYREKYQLSLYEAVLECHLMTSYEIAKASASSLGVDFFKRREKVEFKLDKDFFTVSDCLKYKVLPEKFSNTYKVWAVDPWGNAFNKGFEKLILKIPEPIHFGIISLDDFDALISQFISIEEPVL